MQVILEFDDVEIWYEVDTLNICRNPYGLVSVDGQHLRPAGDYVVLRGCRLDQILPAAGADA